MALCISSSKFFKICPSGFFEAATWLQKYIFVIANSITCTYGKWLFLMSSCTIDFISLEIRFFQGFIAKLSKIYFSEFSWWFLVISIFKIFVSNETPFPTSTILDAMFPKLWSNILWFSCRLRLRVKSSLNCVRYSREKKNRGFELRINYVEIVSVNNC